MHATVRARSLAAGALVAVLVATAASAQASGGIRISGDVPTPLTLSMQELHAIPHVQRQASDHGKAPAMYDGIPLRLLLERAGVKFGEALRGPRLAASVVVDAADGYRASFAIAELDSAFVAKDILLVDKRDGAPLAANEGPLRIVVPDEKRPARWVRQVVGIRVIPAPNP